MTITALSGHFGVVIITTVVGLAVIVLLITRLLW
jgi:hypothetical protein